MRLNNQLNQDDTKTPAAGTLLAAHPSQQDGYFRHTAILLMLHSIEEGALGLIFNRPLQKTLGQHDLKLSDSKLSEVPLYDGGPVAKDQLILLAWKWDNKERNFSISLC